MIIEQLNHTHRESIKNLYMTPRYLGVDTDSNYFMEPGADFLETAYETFCETYLSNLNNFKAFGSIENGAVTAMMAFYESNDEPAWYGTQIRSASSKALPHINDKLLEHNEANGRFKFYTMFNAKYRKSYRRLVFSESAKERYEYYDEYIVPAKTRCFYTAHWQILFGRMLMPTDCAVRCTMLKQEYREKMFCGGNI